MRPITIKLTKGFYAQVDEMDSFPILGRAWHTHNGYACTMMEGKHVLMHRLLLQPKDKEIVDHINQDKLDNRRSNLRIATRLQNYRNSKLAPKGYTHNPKRGRKPWRAYYAGRTLGYFESEVSARKAYVKAVHQKESMVL